VESLQLAACTTLEEILATAEALQPRLLIVDSVQVMTSLALPGVPGGIQQVRAVAEGLLRYAKTTGTPVVLIGHVTKEGDLAGPRVLSHLVDTVLHLSGDSHRDLRLLTTTKNRFGATAEVGVFAMESKGLVEVPNPSELFLAERAAAAPGSCIAVTLEGTRPLLVEVQALVTPARFAYPQRVTSGFPASRLALIIAVLTRCAGVQLDSSDVFVNVVGGLRLGEPAADLPVALALASSLKKKALPATLAAFGEVGLTGEVRSVTGRELRAKEAKKLGFTVTPERTSLVDLLKKIC
jgi:DNA repair protein RadA/Sms